MRVADDAARVFKPQRCATSKASAWVRVMRRSRCIRERPRLAKIASESRRWPPFASTEIATSSSAPSANTADKSSQTSEPPSSSSTTSVRRSTPQERKTHPPSSRRLSERVHETLSSPSSAINFPRSIAPLPRSSNNRTSASIAGMPAPRAARSSAHSDSKPVRPSCPLPRPKAVVKSRQPSPHPAEKPARRPTGAMIRFELN